VALEAWYPGRDTLAGVRRRVAASLAGTGIDPVGGLRPRRIPDGRWVEVWQKSLAPMAIGRRILAVPGGCRPPARSGRIIIRIPFGQAFGTGEHASTRLCVRHLERALRPGDRVVDVGTGTGILAVAAARLGARSVVAVDSDPVATRVARDTLRRNRVEHTVVLRTGDAADVLKGATFDLALVNIGATVIGRILPALAEALAPGGRAILAGILIEDESLLLERAGRLGLLVAARLRTRPWSSLVLGRPGGARRAPAPRRPRRDPRA
jgi:ribosomal protein L11 methyltransferase